MTHRFLARTLLALWLPLSLATTALAQPPSSPQPAGEPPAEPDTERDAMSETARALYDEARKAWSDKDYQTCQAKATAALAVHQHPKIAAVLGDCALALGHARLAAEKISIALEQLEKDPNEKLKAHLEQRLGEAESKVAKVSLTVNVEGARVTVDGTAVESMTRPIYLEPGSHAIRAEADGHEPAERTVEAKAGEAQALQLVLKKKAAVGSGGAGGAGGAGEEEDNSAAIGAAFGSVGALGLVGVIVGGVLMGVGGNKGKDADALLEELRAGAGRTDPCSSGADPRCAELLDLREKHDTLFNAGLGVLATGGVLLAIGAVGFGAGSGSRGEERGGDNERGKTGPLEISVAPTLGGAIVYGRF